jgi:hypothetical protein
MTATDADTTAMIALTISAETRRAVESMLLTACKGVRLHSDSTRAAPEKGNFAQGCIGPQSLGR